MINSHFEWLKEIAMHCNQNKTEFMLFGEEKFKIQVSGVSITPKEHMKVLGTIIDAKIRLEVTYQKNNLQVSKEQSPSVSHATIH